MPRKKSREAIAIFKIGHGYDVHRLEKNRPLIVGGVQIEHIKGLLGHSDADVLTHAIVDALLGAAGLGDIGKHFPNSDDAYKDVSSIKLLENVGKLLLDCGYLVQNIDSTIIAQSPKFSTYIDEMKKRISEALKISVSSVNIKATTEEGLGFSGRGWGIAAHAVCLLCKKV